MAKFNLVKPVRAVTITSFIPTSAGFAGVETKTYKTATGAAAAWASNVSTGINIERDWKNLPRRDGLPISNPQWPTYDRAYRRVLPIFKKILP